MTGQSQTRSGVLVATRVFRDDISPAADLSNVILFARARRTSAEPYAPPVIVNPAERPAPLPRSTKPWLQALLVVCSLIVHGGLLYLFWQEPEPLAGIGTEVVAVDIVVGDNKLAGSVATPGTDQIERERVDELKPDEKPSEQDRASETREVKPDETPTEVAKEQPAEQPKEQEPDKRQVIAMVEAPQAEIPTVLPRETPPDMQAVITPHELSKAAPPEPQAKKADVPSPETQVANGLGFSSSASMATYSAAFSEHLAKHQQYPNSARSKRIQGHGTVSLSLDASGYVTSVSVAKGTGATVLDEEMIAMVRRASPFPPPPDGQPRKINVPVTFKFMQAGPL